MGALAALGFLQALRRHLPRPWLAVFLVFSIAGATLAVGHIAFLILATRDLNFLLVHVYAGSILVSALTMLAAIGWEWRSRAPADGLHRLGLGSWLAIAAIQMVMYILYLP